VINNQGIIRGETETKFKTLIADLHTSYFLSRNHYLLLLLKRIIMAMIFVLAEKNRLIGLISQVFLQVFFTIKYIWYKPFLDFKMNCLSIINELYCTAVLGIVFLLYFNQADIAPFSVFNKVNVDTNVSYGRIGLICVFSMIGVYFIVTFLLIIYNCYHHFHWATSNYKYDVLDELDDDEKATQNHEKAF